MNRSISNKRFGLYPTIWYLVHVNHDSLSIRTIISFTQIWELWKEIHLVYDKQLIHLFWNLHGTRRWDLKTCGNDNESPFNHNWSGPLPCAISIAKNETCNSAWKAIEISKECEKQPKKAPLELRKIPPLAEGPRQLFVAPSMLHLIHPFWDNFVDNVLILKRATFTPSLVPIIPNKLNDVYN